MIILISNKPFFLPKVTKRMLVYEFREDGVVRVI